MTTPQQLTSEQINNWTEEKHQTVALILKQQLLPIDGEGGVIFPPTYADIGYCIDELSDGTKVAQIDSVGSQANRMEPLFMQPPYSELVPQIKFSLGKDEDEDDNERIVSLLELAHRAADAVVRSSALAREIEIAFHDLLRKDDAGPLAKLAPTSLVFGVWDSRGTGVKCPRLIRSVIRAEDVDVLHSAAQFNSIWKHLSDEHRETFKKIKGAEGKKGKLSAKGFKDTPAIFRTDKIAQFQDGKVNDEARVLGGVMVRGKIYRQTIINLIALRAIHAVDDETTKNLRRYLLGLSLLAATQDMELYLREGCFLCHATADEDWEAISRRGEPELYRFSSAETQEMILDYTKSARDDFEIRQDLETSYKFDIKLAKELLAKNKDDEAEGDA